MAQILNHSMFIYCNTTNICTITCKSNQGCSNLHLYCYGDCFVDCDEPVVSCPTVEYGSYYNYNSTKGPDYPTTTSLRTTETTRATTIIGKNNASMAIPYTSQTGNHIESTHAFEQNEQSEDDDDDVWYQDNTFIKIVIIFGVVVACGALMICCLFGYIILQRNKNKEKEKKVEKEKKMHMKQLQHVQRVQQQHVHVEQNNIGVNIDEIVDGGLNGLNGSKIKLR